MMPTMMLSETSKYATLRLDRDGVIKLRDLIAKSDAPMKQQLLMLCEQAGSIADRMQAFAMGVIAAGAVVDDEQILMLIEREGPALAAAFTIKGDSVPIEEALKAGLAMADRMVAWMQLVMVIDHVLTSGPDAEPGQRVRLREVRSEKRGRRG